MASLDLAPGDILNGVRESDETFARPPLVPATCCEPVVDVRLPDCGNWFCWLVSLNGVPAEPVTGPAAATPA